jgi:hypothetical protein
MYISHVAQDAQPVQHGQTQYGRLHGSSDVGFANDCVGS